MAMPSQLSEFEPPAPSGPTHAVEQAVEPHPTLTSYYTTSSQKREFLRSIFDDTAADYDRVESWLSFGTGRWYRRQALQRAGIKPGMHVLDVATGTGLVAREALALVGPAGSVIGVDPSPRMLQQAKDQLGIATLDGRADRLPVADATADFLSMGYALRHLDDLCVAFAEFHRVLKPGGRVCILEITRPRWAIMRWGLRAYLGILSGVMGRLLRLAPRTPLLWKYYWETIDQCVPPDRVLEVLSHAGFTNVRQHRSLGLFTEFVGIKVASPPA